MRASLSGVPAPVTSAPEVPGVGEQFSPGLSVLGGPDVAGGDLLALPDVEPSPDLHPAVLGKVLAGRVTPVSVARSGCRLQCCSVPYMQEWLRKACRG